MTGTMNRREQSGLAVNICDHLARKPATICAGLAFPQVRIGPPWITQIYEGTNQVQRIVMSRNLP